jgi:type III restriction enzyme
MSGYEVPQPILNSPFDPPAEHWHIVEGEPPVRVTDRRKAVYFYREPKAKSAQGQIGGVPVELALVNLVRERLDRWREQGYPGVTRTTLELLQWWNRDGRERRLFFAQREAAETIIFLTEARADFLQGIAIPRDEPSDSQKAEGYTGFLRYACKMATGAGKTTVMGMLAAWSILNKLNDRSDARFSDVVLIVCPNVTIRDRLRELHPDEGEASLYRTRDLVPVHLMPLLSQGKVIVTNWHVFEPQAVTTGGISSKVNKAGVVQPSREWIVIGGKTTTARGSRYMTQAALDAAIAAGEIEVIWEEKDNAGNLKKVLVRAEKRVESDTALVNRIIGREAGGKQNILVMNDEAHHAYRIKREPTDDSKSTLFDEFEDEEEAEEFEKEATVWIDGLDRIQKLRGINVCIDLSATPYYLGRVGQETNRPFP